MSNLQWLGIWGLGVLILCFWGWICLGWYIAGLLFGKAVSK
jgi:hypothetical protein